MSNRYDHESREDLATVRWVEALEDRIMVRLDEILTTQRETNTRVTRLELRDAWTKGVLAAMGLMLALPAVVASTLGLIYAMRNF